LLATVMGYALMLEGGRGRQHKRPDATDVAVVFPGQKDWHDFRRGLILAARRGAVNVVKDDEEAVLVETAQRHRPIRFSWNHAGGSVQTRAMVERVLSRHDPPVALVGSANTALTVDLAEALASAKSRPGIEPVLLVPWATSVLVQAAPPLSAPISLLDIVPRRTFRFCPNNQREADLVTLCVIEHEPKTPPARVLLAVDPTDPYSMDMAACFRRAISRAAPGAKIEEASSGVCTTGLGSDPGPSELRWAESIWRSVRSAPAGGAIWVVLPLQTEPAGRILAAVRREARARPRDDAPLRVICGDGIGLAELMDYAGLHGFSVWSVASDSGPGSVPGHAGALDVHVLAEVVSALAYCVDHVEQSANLASVLASLNLKADDPNAVGRALAFDRSGERRGSDLGHVLAAIPGRDEILTYTQGPDGRWNAPVPIAPPPLLARP
jgi:hypothetical protein